MSAHNGGPRGDHFLDDLNRGVLPVNVIIAMLKFHVTKDCGHHACDLFSGVYFDKDHFGSLPEFEVGDGLVFGRAGELGVWVVIFFDRMLRT